MAAKPGRAGTGAQAATAPRTARVAARGRTRAGVRRRIQAVAAHVVLIAVAIPFVLPFFWLLTGTFKPSGDLLVVPPVWVPAHWTLDNLRALGSYGDVDLGYYTRNTLYLCVFNVVATVASCSLVAYGFARIRFPGRDLLFAILIATLILPRWATLIPSYNIFKWPGWVGNVPPR